MMLKLLLIIFIKILIINGQRGYKFPPRFFPCGNNILEMYPVVEDNSWTGFIKVSEHYPNLREALLELRINAEAIVTVDSEDGETLSSSNQLKVINFFRPEYGYLWLLFKVEGQVKGKFPNVLSLSLNSRNICSNPREWKPSIELIKTGIISKNLNRLFSKPCGQRKISHQGLITNGDPSNEGDWPWHAALFHLKGSDYKYVCGGSLLNTNNILTAAHCVIEDGHFMIAERLLIKLGLHNRLLAGRNVQEFHVYKIIPHEEYDFERQSNDIALIKLATEVTLTSYVQPICLWPKDQIDFQNVVNKSGTVVGWGFTEKKNEASIILNQVKMPIVDAFTCLESNRKFFGFQISDNNFCAGFRNGTSVCNGDSGGGLTFVRDNVYKIRGLVSLGPSKENENVCNPQEYVLFTDVAKYVDWIESKIKF